MSIATTIFEQLGGNRFVGMTGARNFISRGNSLTFKITKACNKITHVEIELTHSDTYRMVMYNCRHTKNGFKQQIVRDISPVYAGQLQGIFTEETGLYTRL
jgi:hypothetical protein